MRAPGSVKFAPVRWLAKQPSALSINDAHAAHAERARRCAACSRASCGLSSNSKINWRTSAAARRK